MLCCVVHDCVVKRACLAAEANEDAASTMTLAERVKFFNRRALETSALEPSTTLKTPRSRGARFKTQPVTLEELGTAQCMASDNVSHTDRGSNIHVLHLLYLPAFFFIFFPLVKLRL
jgi:hypothetical protein